MNEIIYQKNYTDYKQELDFEIKKAAEGFVKIGYLLKVARDTNVLAESGYQTVAEFAQAEYNLSKDIVSRYIAINDRYSKNGYSQELDEKYKGYGVAKLQEMLTLPDAVVDLVTKDISKREIQELKKEIRDEQQISDLEVLMEQHDSIPGSTIAEQSMYKYFEEKRDLYNKLVKYNYEDSDGGVQHILDILAPNGYGVLTTRLKGQGKIMISIRGKDEDIVFLNTRSGEKHILTWNQFIFNLVNMRLPEIIKEPEETERQQENAINPKCE